MTTGATAHYSHGWLPVVLPAAAETFRVHDLALRDALTASGAGLVDAATPDVEIAVDEASIRGDAPFAVVVVEPSSRADGHTRALGRVTTALDTRRRVARARRALRSRGYDASIFLWDVAQRPALAGFPRPPRRAAELLPQRALAIGRRSPRIETVLEASLRAAALEVGAALRPRWASIRAGVVVVAADDVILRVAVGLGAAQIERNATALQALERGVLPPEVEGRLPRLLAVDREGLAQWSVERLQPGVRPRPSLSPALLDQAIDFLIALHGAGEEAVEPRLLREAAKTVLGVCGSASAARLHELVERVDDVLAGLPRGFSHGDFFSGNLLAEGDRLTGVLDWDAAAPGGLPLTDLLHLLLTHSAYGRDDEWGAAVVQRLLPLARAEGDAAVRRYVRAVGIPADARTLESLVAAYWLEYVAHQLRAHPDRYRQQRWIAENVDRVLPILAAALTNATGAAREARTRTA
jgi:hypothetical protein